MKKRSLFWRGTFASLTVGAMGAVVGIISAYFYMAGQSQPEFVIPAAALAAYQGYSVSSGAIIGGVLAAAATLTFIYLARRRPYPRSIPLGAWLGAAAGLGIGLITTNVVYAPADAYGFLKTTPGNLLLDNLIYAGVDGAIGLFAGYLLAEIGARDLAWWE